MSRPPSEWIPEAHRFIETFDRSNTFEQFWNEYLALFGHENPDVRQVGDDPQDLAAMRELRLALDPFMASHQGKLDTEVIDSDC
ncbi:hypothetical protein [uncultured Luteimonas sp.]|uniref:hypothetical protein n=1 Tax=uncultured Luteimonas sp. TaxID=453144 RepID=UPI0026325288|nr:hypothetical protein [uncultured Luteimonas sp.]